MQRFVIFSFLLALAAISCEEPPIVFSEPQPNGIEAQPYINMLYRGVFFCESDSALVYVKARSIHKERTYKLSIPKMDIDTTPQLSLEGNFLIIEGYDDPIPATIIKDTVKAAVTLRDTLFEMGATQIVKGYKGHQVLSRAITKDKWEVLILSLDDMLDLRLSIAALPDDLESLKEITPVEDLSDEDMIQYRLKPSYIEFGEILNKQLLFQECDYYRRIKQKQQI